MDDERWLDDLISRATRRRLSATRVAGGVAIEFSDGCDAFWVLPGEVLSTLDLPGGVPVDAEHVLEEFSRVDRVRERTLHVIRHYLTSLNIRVTRNRSGRWGIQTLGGLTTSLRVGREFTQRALRGESPAEIVRSRLKESFFCHAPSEKRIARLLSTPRHRRVRRSSTRSAPGTMKGPFATMSGILAVLGICRTLNSASLEKIDTTDDLERASHPDGPIARCLLELGKLLDGVDLSFEWLGRKIQFQFSDGSGSYSVSCRGIASWYSKLPIADQAERRTIWLTNFDVLSAIAPPRRERSYMPRQPAAGSRRASCPSASGLSF